MDNNENLKVISSTTLNESLEAANALKKAFSFVCKKVKENKNIDVESFGEIFYNKFLELVDTLEKRGVPYDDSIVGEVVFSYFDSLTKDAKENLLKCLAVKENEEMFVKKYNEICGYLLDFDLDKDALKVIEDYIDNNINKGVPQSLVDLTVEAFNDELRELNINQTVLPRKIGEIKSSNNRNLEALDNHRSALKDLCNGIVEDKIQIEKYEKNSVNLKPIYIYAHNKMGEIYKYFESKGFAYADSFLVETVFAYFQLLIFTAKTEIEKYKNENSSTFRQLSHGLKGQKFGINHIRCYNDLCDKLVNFSFEENCVEAINDVMDCILIDPENFPYVKSPIERYNYELKKLGIDQVVEERKREDSVVDEIKNKKNLLSNLKNMLITSKSKDKEKKKTLKK